MRTTNEQLQGAIYEEWNNMKGNGKVQQIPFRNAYEAHIFNEHVEVYHKMFIEELQDFIKKNFNREVIIKRYGENLDTFAPRNHMQDGYGDEFNECIYNMEAEKKNKRHNGRLMLEVFRAINEFTRKHAELTQQWWEEFKRVNELEQVIEDHDGKKLHLVEKWI